MTTHALTNTRGHQSESWHAANNGAGARIWFVMRGQYGPYHQASNGRLIRYGSHESALAVAMRLNHEEEAKIHGG